MTALKLELKPDHKIKKCFCVEMFFAILQKYRSGFFDGVGVS